ncbi:MAG: sulfatase-like hydrolase/transferase [bacterium]|nr:sulfatase-like hydrolase/transferase [bacterium]
MADDLGYGELGCTGHATFRTPVLDGLAARGLRFIDYHSNGAVCSPTRAALMTGRYQTRAGIEGVVTAKSHRDTGLALEESTLAEELGAAGYATALYGKWHLGYSPDFNPVHQGFDEFRGFVSGNVDLFSHIDQVGMLDWWHDDTLRPEPGYVTELITDHAVRFVTEHASEPFFLYLPHAAPHYPYQGPHDAGYREVGDPKPVGGVVPDKARAYREMVESLDAQVGRILDTLDELDLRDDTLVIFCSDNGGTGRHGSSNGPLRGKKGQFYEGGHRVPCIVSWPGRIAAGRVSDEPVMSIDFAPTLLRLAGARESSATDGVDLRGHWLDGAPVVERALFWRRSSQGRYAVRRGGWKLHRSSKRADLELFDLRADPGETTDLASAHPERVSALLAEYEAWESEVTAGVQPRAK